MPNIRDVLDVSRTLTGTELIAISAALPGGGYENKSVTVEGAFMGMWFGETQGAWATEEGGIWENET